MFKTLHRSGKLQINEENISITDTEELKILGTDDHYKFLGKCENSVQLEQQVCNEASSEYLKRLSVIWSSNNYLHAKKSTSYQDLCFTHITVPHVDNRLDSNPTERHRQLDKQERLSGRREECTTSNPSNYSTCKRN